MNRLPEHPSHKIDRSRTFAFTFDGKTYPAFAGDTIASALWASGIKMLGRSFKYHRPRGPFAFTFADTNGLVRVGDEPNVRPAARPVEPGLVVESQNSWPSLRADLMSLTSFGSPLMPVGFYYKAFIRPRSLWPVFETMLRNAAGLGYVTPETPATEYDKKHEFADVLVIGGGAAGMSAALSAANAGADVLLLEERPYLGGHLAYERQPVPTENGPIVPYELAAELARRIENHPNIRVGLDSLAFGVYAHNWIGALQNQTRLLKIRANSLVIATGAFERPILFENNDLPGILLGSAARRLIHLYGVKPGQRAVVLSANDDGLRTALDLQAVGVELRSVIELRRQPDSTLLSRLAEQGVTVRTDRVVTEAKGSPVLTGVALSQRDEMGHPLPGTEEFARCDLLVTSTGWIPALGLLDQAGAGLAYDEQRAEYLPQALPPTVYAAGRVAGTHTVEAELMEGELVGLEAAAAAGFGSGGSESLTEQVAARKAAEPGRTASRISLGEGHHRFVSFDEDVTAKDIYDAVFEGYSSIELLKRYSTIGMGPSQGKYESAAMMALCAQAAYRPISEVGGTTGRPPFNPVPLGAFAGRNMEPVKYTPMHDWHIARGATMMNAGLWKRPEHYGNPVAETLITRHTLGLIDVSTLGKIQLRGPDVPALLERLYTNRWAKLKPGRARYGVMCTPEGIVFDDGVAARLDEEHWYITTTSGGATAVYEEIEWYLQSGWDYRVELAPLTDAYAAMNLTGPQARTALQPLTDIDLSPEAFPYMAVRQGDIAGVPVIVWRIGFTGELGYEIHTPAGYGLYLWETLIEAGEPHRITPFGVEAQRIMRLEKGHIIIGQDTDAMTDPLMADLDWAVKLDKADFIGKPSLVRIQERGVTHKLVGWQMVDPKVVPEEANQIVRPNPDWPLDLEIIGRITSARYSPTLEQSIGLGWLPVEMSRPGAEFTVRIRGELHPGRVVSLPFYDPAGARLRS